MQGWWRTGWELPRGREVGGILLTGLGVLMVVALATYSPTDPSFFTSTGSRPANWVGPLGAQAAALLYEGFGLAAWFAPLILFVAALRRLRPTDEEGLTRSAAVGLTLVGLSTSVLLTLVIGRIEIAGAPLMAGGLLGTAISGWLVAGLSEVGSAVVAGTLLLAGAALAARSSLAELSVTLVDRAISGAGPWLARAGTAVARLGSQGAAAVRRWIERPARRAIAPAAPQVRAAAPRRRPEPEPRQPAVTKPREERVRAAAARPPRARQARLPVEIPAGSRVQLPPVDLLAPPPPQEPVDRKELLATARQIEARCAEFAVDGTVTEIHPGPVVTTFEFRPEAGIKLSRITALADDLALALEAENVRIDRIPGRPTVGIEVPNRNRQLISFREVVESDAFRRSADHLTLALGKTQSGEVFCTPLSKMPHLLIAGATGSGKSVGLNTIITSILYRSRPDDVKFILIDPKMLELGLYEGIPHLLVPVVTDMALAANALKWAVREMERRYRLLASCNVRHVDGFNRRVENDPGGVQKAIEAIPRKGSQKFEAKKLPKVVIVVDELADLMMTTRQDTEEAIARLAQKARAVGIHLVLATQRPSVDILTGTIKANFPARIAYRVFSKIDSRTILDGAGAERLLGEGDMLHRQPASARLIRIHGAFISGDESLRVVAWLKQQAKAEYDRSVLEDPQEAPEEAEGGGRGAPTDPMYEKALRLVVASGQASTSFLQRRMRLGYSRAARIIDELEANGIIGPADGSRPREVLVDTEFLERLDQQRDEEP